MQTVFRLLSQYRRGVARAVLIAGVLVVSAQVVPAIRRDTDIEVVLGRDHREVLELRLSYLQDDQEVQGVSFRFEGGAPDRVRHHVSLPAGDFEVRCWIRQRSGSSVEYVREVRIPAEGLVRIRLGEGSA